MSAGSTVRILCGRDTGGQTMFLYSRVQTLRESCQNGWCCPVNINSNPKPPPRCLGAKATCSSENDCRSYNGKYNCINGWCCPFKVNEDDYEYASCRESKGRCLQGNRCQHPYQCNKGWCCPPQPVKLPDIPCAGSPKRCLYDRECTPYGNYLCTRGYCCSSPKAPSISRSECLTDVDCGRRFGDGYLCDKGVCRKRQFPPSTRPPVHTVRPPTRSCQYSSECEQRFGRFYQCRKNVCVSSFLTRLLDSVLTFLKAQE
ncbi:unnamed protein product [Soboliphyme baturini]|uniref:EB domain-containing protein n=1 Tax=Soboliphyme baturini TaxID=241478 RepID=A0A183IU22_9BILA|nr:unnamed protein product [Soboliphyme baturini]